MRYVLLIGCLLLAACQDDSPSGPPGVTPSAVPGSITISPTSVSFNAITETKSLTASVKDRDGKTISGAAVDWSTSDASVATVSSSGEVTSAGDGEATIMATSATHTGIKKKAGVTVSQQITGIVLSSTSVGLRGIGNSVQLTATMVDSNGTPMASGASVVWSTSDASIATVSSSGLITSVGVGTVTITVSSGGVSTTITIEVSVYTAVSSGGSHTCALTSGGSIECWGSNEAGQLGGPGGSSHEPQLVSGSYNWQAVATGRDHTCALTTSSGGVSGVPGTLYCWGRNANGQLGDGTEGNRAIPTLVLGAGEDWRGVSASGWHTCGVSTSHKGYCWGYNASGQLGDETEISASSPSLVLGGLAFRTIVTGEFHTCGFEAWVRPGWCWGYNASGQVGDGTSSTDNRLIPTEVEMAVAGQSGWRSIAPGWDHTCGLDEADDRAYCWGSNQYSQLGTVAASSSTIPAQNGERRSPRNFPDGLGIRDAPGLEGISTDRSFVGALSGQAVAGGHTWEMISARGLHTCGVTKQGEGYCWGYGADGRLGNGATADQAEPAKVSGGHTWQSISTGLSNTCGVTTDGALYCWGYNEDGQLGDDSTVERFVPTLVAGQETAP